MSRAFYPCLFGLDLDSYEMREVQKRARQRLYRSGQEIFVAGDLTEAVFTLSRGVVGHSKLLSDGRRQVLGFRLPGDFLGTPFAVRHTLSAHAIGEVAIWRFRRDEFFDLVDGHPSIMWLCLKTLTRQLEQAQDHILLLGSGTAEEKVASFLLTWRNRFAGSQGFSVKVPLPMRRGEIADYLGLTLETVSRTFTRFERKNFIEVAAAGATLLDIRQLELIARPFEHVRDA